MLQLIQDLNSGETGLIEIPIPKPQSGTVLIKTHRSLVSLGTERMLVEFGKANYLQKARQQPEKVKQVIQKIQSDGLKPTMQAVFRKLGEPIPLGYSNAGEVIAVGEGVNEFKIGDRVVSNGHHAEIVCVPKNLVAKIPDEVSFEEASFTVIGAIALQGIRLLNPLFGETIVVTGLGLIGLIAAQLLHAHGCRVIGLDIDDKKLSLAESWGITTLKITPDIDPVAFVKYESQSIGADAVLITASSKSNTIISQAANMCRKRGRIVLTGVIPLNIQRSDFYEKELTFQVSCSYGPGRYDTEYEQKGLDYPISYVRWTEKRNFEAVLHALATKKLLVKPLITEIVPLNDYLQIYGDLKNHQSIASILKYEASVPMDPSIMVGYPKSFKGQKGVIGVIGAGNFTASTILPALSKLNAEIKSIASSKGLSGTILAKKFSIQQSTTNVQSILNDPDIDTVMITTRHHLHANQVIQALKVNKNVFVEKPLGITMIELDEIASVYQKGDASLTVGFNRRFSPFIRDAKQELGTTSAPINVIATMNAGFIPQDHWTQDMEIGGGRIIGEACHLIDLITYLTGSLVSAVVMNALGPNPSGNTDNASILLRYQNGSQGMIQYLSNGNKAYSKERVEIYGQGRTIVIDNYRKSKYYGFKSSGMRKTQDKGHQELFRLFLQQIRNGGDPIIPFNEIMNTSRTAIAAISSLTSGTWVDVA